MPEFDKSDHVPSKVLNRKRNTLIIFHILQSLILIALLLHLIGLINIPMLP